MFVNHLEIFPDQRGQNPEPFYLVKNTASGRYVRLGGAETRYLLQKLHTAQTLPGLEQAQSHSRNCWMRNSTSGASFNQRKGRRRRKSRWI